jgi:GT2 family glycosyltransferase
VIDRTLEVDSAAELDAGPAGRPPPDVVEEVERDLVGALTSRIVELERDLGEATELVQRLAVDRDARTEEVETWRREVQRLAARGERRLRIRLRRLWFPILRSVWWKLPRVVRDRLRPILFPRSKVLLAPTLTAAPIRPEAPRIASRVGRQASHPVRRPAADVGTVSTVIPTLNAGPQFARVLAALRRQEGLAESELVVIDSGSTDGTIELATAAGARVLRVSPDEFQHGRTRNAAIEASNGETIVLMVQDAILLGPTAVRDLAQELRDDPSLAGVSARHVPRSDADLFGAFVIYSHQEAMSAARSSAVGNGRASALERRARAGLDNVCAAIRREAWDTIRFAEVDFAEDLDFGVRALEAGWTIGVSDSVAVAHSHTRDAAYAARRSVVDRLFVAPLVGDDALSRPGGEQPAAIMRAARALLAEIEGALALGTPNDAAPLRDTLDRLTTILDVGAPRIAPSGALAVFDRFLGVEEPRRDERVIDLVRGEFLALLRWAPLRMFAAAQPGVPPAEAREFVAKLAGLVVGRCIGDSFRVNGRVHEPVQFLERV